jgi:hypothetical protein
MKTLQEIFKLIPRGRLDEEKKKDFKATGEFNIDDTGIWVLVMDHADSDRKGYHGVNVQFDEDGDFVGMEAGDEHSEFEKKHFKNDIIAAAKKLMKSNAEIKDHLQGVHESLSHGRLDESSFMVPGMSEKDLEGSAMPGSMKCKDFCKKHGVKMSVTPEGVRFSGKKEDLEELQSCFFDDSHPISEGSGREFEGQNYSEMTTEKLKLMKSRLSSTRAQTYPETKQTLAAIDKELKKRGAMNEAVKEGDVVEVHQHMMGKPMDRYGKFNIEKLTPSHVIVWDHSDGKTLKFSRKTGRGVGDSSGMLIKNVASLQEGRVKDHFHSVEEEDGKYCVLDAGGKCVAKFPLNAKGKEAAERWAKERGDRSLENAARAERLKEEREAGLTYTPKAVKGKIERVVVQLEGAKSSAFTKLAARYKDLDAAMNDLTEARNALNAEIKDRVESLFNAEDVVLTRVVETVSMTATVSKAAAAEDKVNYEAVVDALSKLVPDLTSKIEELKKQFTVAGKAKSPGLRVSVAEGAIDTLIGKLKSFLTSIKSWGSVFDKKLSKVKGMMPLTEEEEAKKGEVELSTLKAKTIPMSSWPDGLVYHGHSVFKLYDSGAIEAAEKSMKQDDLDMQECYLGYSPEHDLFIMGFDGWMKHYTRHGDVEDTENCSPYIKFKVDHSTGAVKVISKGSHFPGSSDMWYGRKGAGGLKAVRKAFPDMIDVRLD